MAMPEVALAGVVCFSAGPHPQPLSHRERGDNFVMIARCKPVHVPHTAPSGTDEARVPLSCEEKGTGVRSPPGNDEPARIPSESRLHDIYFR
jgi:hypothetical protein